MFLEARCHDVAQASLELEALLGPQHCLASTRIARCTNPRGWDCYFFQSWVRQKGTREAPGGRFHRRASGRFKGPEARPPARGLPGEPRRASVTHLIACAVGSHGTRASAAARLPSSRSGTCGTAIARLSSLPSFKRPANGGSGPREAAWSRLRRGRRVGRTVPRPRPPPAPRTRSLASVRARAVLRSEPLFLTAPGLLSGASWLHRPGSRNVEKGSSLASQPEGC